jgi:hypothetical protein
MIGRSGLGLSRRKPFDALRNMRFELARMQA